MNPFTAIFLRYPWVNSVALWSIALGVVAGLTGWMRVSSLLVYLGCFIAVYLIRLDPPMSPDGFLLTRPVSRRGLSGAKAALIFGVGALVPSLSFLTIALLSGLPLGEAPVAALRYLFDCGALVAVVSLCASATRTTKDFVAVLIAALLVGYVVLSALDQFAAWPLRAFYLAPPFELASSLSRWLQTTTLLALVLITGAAAFAAYRLQIRRFTWGATAVLIGAGLAVLGIQWVRIVKVGAALQSTGTLHEETVEIRESRLALVSHRSIHTPGGTAEEMRFVLKAGPQPGGNVRYLLRFRDLTITDESGREFPIPVRNMGILPCLEREVLEDFLMKARGTPTTLVNAAECELGESYTLPQNAVINAKIPRVRGTVYGMNLTLSPDYRVSLRFPFKATPQAPLYLSNYLSKARRWRDSFPRIKETHLLPALLSHPVETASLGDPLYAHWFAVPNLYLLVDPERNEAIRLWSAREDTSSQSAGHLFSGSKRLFPHDSTGLSYLSDELLEQGELIRAFPRISGAFTAPVDLRDVPIVRKTSQEIR